MTLSRRVGGSEPNALSPGAALVTDPSLPLMLSTVRISAVSDSLGVVDASRGLVGMCEGVTGLQRVRVVGTK
jgi:hypothetical protein